MSPSKSTAKGLSPDGFYPSPPTSPRPAPRDQIVAGNNTEKSVDIAKIVALASREPEVEEAKQPPVERPTTPHEPAVSDANDPATVGEVPDLDSWKVALSLDRRKCGATKKNSRDDGAPCEKELGAKKIDQIEAVIELLRRPGVSDLEVETHLNYLAKLVYCHYHDDPPRRQSRVTEWLAVLPGPPRLPTPERQLRDVLGPAPTNCISLTQEKRPCRCAVSRTDLYHSRKTIRVMLQTARAPGDGEDTLEFLSLVLRYHMLCSTHHRHPPKAYQAFWIVKIDTFRAACEAEKEILESKNAQTDVTKLPEREKKKDLYKDLDNSAFKTPPSPPSNIKDDSKRAARYWSDKGYDTSSFIILGKNDSEEDNVAPHDKISRVAQELLRSENKKTANNEVSPGLVYVFAVPGNEGFVKVGFTTKEVKERHEKWSKDCNRDSTLLYPLEKVPPKVKHAHRVERLVHAELMEHNVRIYCERCEKKHIEWFEAEADVAIASVKKWSLWMEANPYEERLTREGSRWHLKETERERLYDIGTFLQDLQEGVQKLEAAE